MKKEAIIDAIVSRVRRSHTVDYSSWRIGLTHNPDDRKQQHDNERRRTAHWAQWQADSLADAKHIESYFISEKHMQGKTGGALDAGKTVYVYIF